VAVTLLSAGNRRDTTIAWGFVVGQFALLAAILLLPSSSQWVAPRWVASGARWLQLVGIVVLVVAMINLGRSLTPLPSPVPHGELRTGGLYRLVRHPIYTAIIALAVGSAVRSGNVAIGAATVALIAWFMLKARWEETQLGVRYPGYQDYAARTPRFVPLWPVRRRPYPARASEEPPSGAPHPPEALPN
jgi:protein-S-isoprenylcysteine O-methyltransferase Ste14